MDNNYRTILATCQKSSPTPAANQRTFFYPIKLTDFFFSIERKKIKAAVKVEGLATAQKI
jgi:hypothetical protein